MIKQRAYYDALKLLSQLVENVGAAFVYIVQHPAKTRAGRFSASDEVLTTGAVGVV